MPVSRRQIVRACKTRGWTIQPAALEGIERYLGQTKNDMDVLDDFLDLVGGSLKGKMITSSLMEEIMPEAETVLPQRTSSAHCFSDLQVVNAFQTPKLLFEVMRKQFYVEDKRQSLFGTAEDKVCAEMTVRWRRQRCVGLFLTRF
jgi:hypothetical protein